MNQTTPTDNTEFNYGLSFTDLVQFVAGRTGEGYAKSAAIVDRLIQPHIDTVCIESAIDELYHLKYAFTEKKDEYLNNMLDLRIATLTQLNPNKDTPQ